MKVCLLLQRKFAYLGHQIAINLKEDHGINDFCGYVYLRSSLEFLENQKEINYSTLLLDEEIHKQYKTAKLDLEFLKKLEQDYGIPNLWPYISVDRIIRFNQLVREYPYDKSKYTHEEMMLMVQIRAKAIIDMLDKEKPDALICSVVGGLGSYLLYEIAKKKGIKILVISLARTGVKYLISEDYAYFPQVEKRLDMLIKDSKKSSKYDEAKKHIIEFRKKPEIYDKTLKSLFNRAGRLQQMNFLLPKNILRYLKWLKGIIAGNLTSEEKNDYSYVRYAGKLLDQIKRKSRNLIGISKFYEEIDKKEDYAFFPLHFEPEITTMLYAPHNVDQLNVIRHVARSLPLHFKLYVKEHPAMIGYRSRKFYKELVKIPNVKFINPKYSSFEITPDAKLITTITGTVGWEGLFLGKPVITFGDVFYNKLSMVKECKSMENLPFLIKGQLENFNYNEEELINFLGCILEDSVDVNLEYLWHKEPDINKKKEALKPLTNLIIKNFNQ